MVSEKSFAQAPGPVNYVRKVAYTVSRPGLRAGGAWRRACTTRRRAGGSFTLSAHRAASSRS